VVEPIIKIAVLFELWKRLFACVLPNGVWVQKNAG